MNKKERIEIFIELLKFKKVKHNKTVDIIFSYIEEYFEDERNNKEVDLTLTVFHIVALKDSRDYPLIFDKNLNLKFWEILNRLK